MMQESWMEISDKQRHIIEVAERLFATKGYDGTSVRDIAHEAGVNIAMISYYFGSKEKLLEALFMMRYSYVGQHLKEMLENKELEPLEKIYKLIDYYIQRITSQQHFHQIMVREQISQKDSAVKQLILDLKRQNQSLIKQLIQEGQKKGVFKKNIDISMMMLTLIGTANQLISTQHHFREIHNLMDMSDEDFQKLIHKKLSVHLKTLFKAILTYER